MNYLLLFLTFLKIGAVSFGGGYGMIALIRESVLANGWMTESELLNFIAVAESTPGPIAVNIATFIGSSQAGIAGAFLATLGVILPSFVIILIIAALIKNLLKFAGVKAALGGMRPAIVGMILATAFTMLMSVMFGMSVAGDALSLDGRSALILGALAAAYVIYRDVCPKPRAPLFSGAEAKTLSPVAIIIISGLMGMVLYSF